MKLTVAFCKFYGTPLIGPNSVREMQWDMFLFYLEEANEALKQPAKE